MSRLLGLLMASVVFAGACSTSTDSEAALHGVEELEDLGAPIGGIRSTTGETLIPGSEASEAPSSALFTARGFQFVLEVWDTEGDAVEQWESDSDLVIESDWRMIDFECSNHRLYSVRDPAATSDAESDTWLAVFHQDLLPYVREAWGPCEPE